MMIRSNEPTLKTRPIQCPERTVSPHMPDYILRIYTGCISKHHGHRGGPHPQECSGRALSDPPPRSSHPANGTISRYLRRPLKAGRQSHKHQSLIHMYVTYEDGEI